MKQSKSLPRLEYLPILWFLYWQFFQGFSDDFVLPFPFFMLHAAWLDRWQLRIMTDAKGFISFNPLIKIFIFLCWKWFPDFQEDFSKFFQQLLLTIFW